MNRPRHQARIAALQGLYQLDVQRQAADVETYAVVQPVISEDGLSNEAADYARSLVAGAWSKHEQYDRLISGVSEHWDVSRMAVVDRNILRLALFEIIERPDVPVPVVFDEAIEIGREFGAAETPQFINGVLDAIWKQQEICRIARPDSSPPAPSGDSEQQKIED